MINDKTVVALIQARSNSTRLPKKHFRKIGDRLLLDWLVDRLRTIQTIDKIVISTTSEPEDDCFKTYALSKGIGCYAYDGDENDVVDRHYSAFKDSQCDYAVVVSGDCPLLDTDYISRALETLGPDCDYVRALNWPEYLIEGIEVLSQKGMDVLKTYSLLDYEKENFSYIVENKPLPMSLRFIPLPETLKGRDYRISVDNKADLDFMNSLYSFLTQSGRAFDVFNSKWAIAQNPRLLNLNKHIGKKVLGEQYYRFYIWTEASKDKGLGHLKRMTVLGKYLNENRNNGVRYGLSRDEVATAYMNRLGYEIDFDLVDDENELVLAVNACEAEILIIDRQQKKQIEALDFKAIKEKTGLKRIIVWDHFINNPLVDLSVLQGYQKAGENLANSNIFFGPEAILIGEEYRNLEAVSRDSVVISFGGTDFNNMTRAILERFLEPLIETQLNMKVVLGPYYAFESDLEAFIKEKNVPVTLYKNPENLAEIFNTARVGICYYGVTYYEMAYLGVKTIPILTDIIYKEQYLEASKHLKTQYYGDVKALDTEQIASALAKPFDVENVEGLISNREVLYDAIVGKRV